MLRRDSELEQALCDIANRKGNWQERAPSLCYRAMHRLNELENALDKIKEKAAEFVEVIEHANQSEC